MVRAPGSVHDQAAHGPQQLVLKRVFARLEPVAFVVLLQLPEKGNARRPDTGKRRIIDGASHGHGNMKRSNAGGRREKRGYRVKVQAR